MFRFLIEDSLDSLAYPLTHAFLMSFGLLSVSIQFGLDALQRAYRLQPTISILLQVCAILLLSLDRPLMHLFSRLLTRLLHRLSLHSIFHSAFASFDSFPILIKGFILKFLAMLNDFISALAPLVMFFLEFRHGLFPFSLFLFFEFFLLFFELFEACFDAALACLEHLTAAFLGFEEAGNF